MGTTRAGVFLRGESGIEGNYVVVWICGGVFGIIGYVDQWCGVEMKGLV